MRFENLDIWKRSSRLCVEVYKELAYCKDYGFKDQITRCSLSIPSNIAEGSSGELRTQIYIGIEIGYVNKDKGLHWINETEQLSKMLSALIKHRSL